MLSKINVSFDIELTSLGELVTALSEMFSLRVQDLHLKDKKEIEAVAELFDPATARRGPRGPYNKKTTNNDDDPLDVHKMPTRMPRVNFTVGDAKHILVPAGNVNVRNTRYCKLSDLTNAKSLNDLSWHISDPDCVICPSTASMIRKNFIEDHVWKSIRGKAEIIQNIRYVAAYESRADGGRGAVVAYAPVLKYTRR